MPTVRSAVEAAPRVVVDGHRSPGHLRVGTTCPERMVMVGSALMEPLAEAAGPHFVGSCKVEYRRSPSSRTEEGTGLGDDACDLGLLQTGAKDDSF